MNIDTEDIKLRIEAIQDAIKRSRLALIVVVIVSASVFLAVWNAYFSWYRSFATRSNFDTNRVTRYAQTELVRGWVDSNIVSVSLLGIRIGVSDLAVIGSLALAVAAACFFYTARKENHLIGSLLRQTQLLSPGLRRLVYHGVIGYLVFITITKDDRPIRHLAEGGEDKSLFFVRPVMNFLLYLPAVVILFVMAADFLSVFWLHAAFRPDHLSLKAYFQGSDWLVFGLIEAFAAVLLGFTYTLCKRSVEFSGATKELLDEYLALLGRDIAYPPPDIASASARQAA